MAIGVSQPTAGRLMVQKIADYRLHLAASTALWQIHKRPERLSDLKDLPAIEFPFNIFFTPTDNISSHIICP